MFLESALNDVEHTLYNVFMHVLYFLALWVELSFYKAQYYVCVCVNSDCECMISVECVCD